MTLRLTVLIAVGLLIAGLRPAHGQTFTPAGGNPGSAAASTRVFEMRTYTPVEGRFDDLLARFRNHTVRLFERHGMTNVGYWIPRDGEGAGQRLVYVLAYPSREAAERSWVSFRADPEWVAARTASEANGPILQGVVSVFLDPADFSPMQ